MRILSICWRDFFSFELVFILFIFAGAYKAAPALELTSILYDPTVITFAAGLLSAGVILMRRGVFLRCDVMVKGSIWNYLFLYLMLLTYAVVSYFSGEIHSDNANIKIQKLIVLNTWALLAPLFIINNRERIERFLRLLFLFVLIVSIDGIVRGYLAGESRFFGPFGGEDYQALGVIAGMGIVIVLVDLTLEVGQVKRVIMGVVGALLVIVLLLAGARQALAGIIVVGVFLVYALAKARSQARVFKQCITAVLSVAIMFVLVKEFALSEVYLDWGVRRLFAFLGDERVEVFKSTGRPDLWSVGFQVWKEYPLFGAGFGSFSEVSGLPGSRHPHNFFVEMLSDLGLVGFLLGCALIWLPMRRIIGLRSESEEWVALTLGALWLHLFTCAMVSGDITENRQIFTFSALILTNAAELTRKTPGRVSVNGRVPTSSRKIPQDVIPNVQLLRR